MTIFIICINISVKVRLLHMFSEKDNRGKVMYIYEQKREKFWLVWAPPALLLKCPLHKVVLHCEPQTIECEECSARSPQRV